MALKRLAGRIAIVTASTDGIGFSIAQRLAREGAKVIISSRKQKNVDEATKLLRKEGLDVKGLVCHVANVKDRQKLFEEASKIGGLDILVSNAAVNPTMNPILDCPEDVWDKIFEVNVKSSFMLAKEALPLLEASKAGRIIFISSIAGYDPSVALGAYGVSKTALLGLVKAISLQLAPHNITVNSIAPGMIRTRFSNPITSNEDTFNHLLSTIPMGRIGEVGEIAGAAAFLASDDGSYITGENLIVSGGMQSRL